MYIEIPVSSTRLDKIILKFVYRKQIYNNLKHYLKGGRFLIAVGSHDIYKIRWVIYLYTNFIIINKIGQMYDKTCL